MKKIAILCLILVASLSTADACSVCGCGVGNYHYGILPQFRKNFIGIRYRYSSFVSTLDQSHGYPFSYETFRTAELWGRFYPAKKIQVFVFIPFNVNERREGPERKTMTGLGDIVVSANYNLVNTYDSLTSGLQHNLLIGGGLKLPTGQYRAIENGLTVNQNFQLGTGSVDFLFNLIYTLRYQRWGLNTELSYSLNTTNKDEYKFGNATRVGLTAFYILRAGPFTAMPNAGINAEFFKDNKQFTDPFPDTGGSAILYQAGAEIYYRSLALGFSGYHPGKQALFNGKVESNDRISLHVTVMF